MSKINPSARSIGNYAEFQEHYGELVAFVRNGLERAFRTNGVEPRYLDWFTVNAKENLALREMTRRPETAEVA